MSLAEYEEFVYGAGLLDDGRPRRAAGRSSPSGSDREPTSSPASQELRIVADGHRPDARRRRPHLDRRPQGHENFPDGEVFTAPLETSVEGDDPLHVPGGLPAAARSTA